MGLTIIGADDVSRTLSNIKKQIKFTSKKIIKVAGEVRNGIQKRTIAGKNMKLSSMPAYTKATKQSRSARGRSVGHRTLSFTGAMLNSMSIKPITAGAEIYYNNTGERNKARWHHFGTNSYPISVKTKKVLADAKAGMFFGTKVTHPGLPVCNFFGIDNKQEKYIMKELEAPIVRAMR